MSELHKEKRAKVTIINLLVGLEIESDWKLTTRSHGSVSLHSLYTCPFTAYSSMHTSMHQYLQVMLTNIKEIWYEFSVQEPFIFIPYYLPLH